MTMIEDVPAKALVVEDDPDYAVLLARTLEDDGFAVRIATDGEHALNAVQKERPDVITLDIQMPRKSGLLFYRQLKCNPEYRRIPVVVVTGITRGDRDTEVFIRTFLEVDHLPLPAAYLEKPAEAEDLLNTVRASLRANNG